MSKVISGVAFTDDRIKQGVKANASGTGYGYGNDDEMLDFGSASGFNSEESTGRTFKFEIQNKGTEDINIALNPGRYNNAADIEANVDAILTDGTIGSGDRTAVVVGSPRKVKSFLDYLRYNPTRIRKIHIRVDDPAQLDNPLVFRNDDPFKTPVDSQVVPSGHQKSSDPTQTVITLDTQILGDKQILSVNDLLLYKVSAGRKVTLTMTFGASLDLAKGLNNKFEKAATNMVASVFK